MNPATTAQDESPPVPRTGSMISDGTPTDATHGGVSHITGKQSPATSPAAARATSDNPGAGIDYELFLDCVHCGLCTASCPTYVETGQRERQPARPHLPDAVRHRWPPGAQRRSPPPSGAVPRLPRLRNGLPLGRAVRQADRAVPRGDGSSRPTSRATKTARLVPPLHSVRPVSLSRANCGRRSCPARIAQRLGLMTLLEKTGLLRLLPPRLRQLVAMLPPPRKKNRRCPKFLPAIGPPPGAGGAVHRLRGRRDVPPHELGHRPRAATERLRRGRAAGAGLLRSDPLSRRQQRAGPRAGRRQRRGLRRRGVDAVIVNVAGCGSMLKDYGHHWHDDRADGSRGVRRQDARRQRVSRRLGPDRAGRRNAAHGHLSRRLPLGPRAKNPRSAAAAARADSGPETGRPARDRTLLRRGRHLQPDASPKWPAG